MEDVLPAGELSLYHGTPVHRVGHQLLAAGELSLV